MKNLKKVITSRFNIPLFTLVPFIGYLITYQFQSGYFNFFNIPSYFIDLSPANIATAIITSAIFVFMFLPMIDSFLVPQKGKRNIGLESIIWTSLPIVLTLYLMESNSSTKSIILVSLAVILFFILHVLYYKVKIIRSIFQFLDSPNESFFRTRLGLSYFSVLTLLILSAFIFTSFNRIGYFTAKNTSKFQYLNLNNVNYAVIAYSDDKLLIMPINMENRTIEKKLFIYKIDDLTTEKVPLSLKEINSIKTE